MEGPLLVLFDGDWIAQQLYYIENVTGNGTLVMPMLGVVARAFFEAAASRPWPMAFMAVGGRVLALLEVLYVAGVCPEPEELCPADQASPLAIGYKCQPRASVLIVEGAGAESVLEALAGCEGEAIHGLPLAAAILKQRFGARSPGMEPSAIEAALREFVKALRERLGKSLMKVVLFGSYAKGTAGPESDVDVLVVHAHPNPEKALSLIAKAALEVSLRFDVPLEPIAMTIHESLQKSLFILEVERTGKVLYNVDPAEEAEALARDYAYLAEKWLEHAAKDLDEDPRFAIDAAYNAAELAVRALILLKGETLAKTHGGLIAQFARLYAAPGEIEESVVRELHESLVLRNRARYDPRVILTVREAEKVVRIAKRLIEFLKERLQTQTG